MSDIELHLEGLVAMLGAWAVAALFLVVATISAVLWRRTGNRAVWRPRTAVAFCVSVAALGASFGFTLLSPKARNSLDDSVVTWCAATVIAGAAGFVFVGRPKKT